MILGDILVIWRAAAIWFENKIVILFPVFWWGLMIGRYSTDPQLHIYIMTYRANSKHARPLSILSIRREQHQLRRGLQSNRRCRTNVIYHCEHLCHAARALESLVYSIYTFHTFFLTLE